MNWFKAKGMLSSGVVEGFNDKAKLTMRKSYGFQTSEGAEVVVLFNSQFCSLAKTLDDTASKLALCFKPVY